MNRQAIFPIAGMLLLFALPGTLEAQYEHPDLKSGKKTIRSVVILPPEASLVKSGMKGAEPLVAEGQTLESGLASVVGETMSEKGCNIVPDAVSPAALEKNPDLKYALADLQTHYDKLQVLLSKKPKDIRDGRFSLGDEAANFSPGAAADALVFARARGTIPTTGLKTFVVITGMGVAYSRVALDIAVADAQTGAILYFAKPNSYGNFVGHPESMKKAIEKPFSKFACQPLPNK